MKRKFRFNLLGLTFMSVSFMVNSNNCNSQLADYDEIIEPYLKQPINSGYLIFHPTGVLDVGQCFEIYKTMSGDIENDVILLDDWIDPQIQMHHYKYRQTYKGIPVEGAVMIEHFDKYGVLQYSNGKLAVDLDLNVNPQITQQAAKNQLLSIFPTQWVMAWEDANYELDLKQNTGDPTATNEPIGELVLALDNYTNLTWNIDGGRYRLAYKFKIHTISPMHLNKTYFVDANTGEVFKELNNQHSDGAATVQNDEGAEVRTIDSKYRGFPNYDHVLETNNGATKIHTKKIGPAWILRAEIDNDSEVWVGNEINATTAHWYAEQVWYFFRDVYERNGTDGANENLRIHVDLEAPDFGSINARYERNSGVDNIYLWQFDELSAGNYADIVAHEFVHGVIEHSSELINVAESGALNESFCDILGVMAKRKALYGGTGSVDWSYGDPAIGITRSLSAPKSDGKHAVVVGGLCNYLPGQPNTYLGEFWQDVETVFCDQQGIHGNNGVQNFWFYLLAEGGSGTNDNDDFYDIAGIGADEAALIAYWNLTNNIIESSQLSDSREGAIASAIYLFGECTNQHYQTTNAWYAVGVGDESECDFVLSNHEKITLSDELLIYPNPTNGNFVVNWTSQTIFDLNIYSSNGMLLCTFKDMKNGERINVSDFANGIYVVEFKNDNQLIRKRIIKN